MSQTFLSFCNWLQNTPYALSIAGSSWAYPFVQTTHYTGLSIWLGTNLAVDFRLLGLVGKRQTPAQLAGSLFAWNWIGFAIVLVGGLSLFSTDAVAFARNPAVQLKLCVFLPVALIIHILVQQKTINSWGKTMRVPMAAKVAALSESLLWLGMACAAASIPYFERFV